MCLVIGGSFWLVISSKPAPASRERTPPAVMDLVRANDPRETAIPRPPKIDFGLDLEAELARPPAFPSASSLPLEKPLDPGSGEEIPKARVISPVSTPLQKVAEQALPAVDPEATKGRFTPWMTPDQINRHFKALNQGHPIDFFDRGHWIVAVEGRWAGEGEEFRVVYEEAPRGKNYAWRYRTSQTREEFTLSMAEFKAQNYQLVQSQSYEMPDGTRRYQGVWHRVR